MCHIDALPGDPRYDTERGLDWIIERVRYNIKALKEGGVDAIMFSNEFSLPYLTKVHPITPITMARIIGEVKHEIGIPYGVNVLWDPEATVELAVAVGAQFVREVFTGVYGSDFGLWNTNCGEAVRSRNALGGKNIRLMFNIYPEASTYLGGRDLADIAKTTVFNAHPDVLCVSGRTAGAETSPKLLQEVVSVVPDIPVFTNTGVNEKNVVEQLMITDGAIIGTAFKKNNDFFELVDSEKVSRLMHKVRSFRT
jgi:membrane complex biogenesis BtpA family protein